MLIFFISFFGTNSQYSFYYLSIFFTSIRINFMLKHLILQITFIQDREKKERTYCLCNLYLKYAFRRIIKHSLSFNVFWTSFVSCMWPVYCLHWPNIWFEFMRKNWHWNISDRWSLQYTPILEAIRSTQIRYCQILWYCFFFSLIFCLLFLFLLFLAFCPQRISHPLSSTDFLPMNGSFLIKKKN